MSATASQLSRMMPVSSAYCCREGLFDEMIELAKSPHKRCGSIINSLLSMPPARLAELWSRANVMFRRMGATFNVYSERCGVGRILPELGDDRKPSFSSAWCQRPRGSRTACCVRETPPSSRPRHVRRPRTGPSPALRISLAPHSGYCCQIRWSSRWQRR